MDWIDFIVWFPVGLWLISFFYNSYYFFKHDDTPLDSVFINLSNTFEEAHDNLTILEKEMGATLKTARNRLRFYEKNARLTRRKYRYYVPYIEPSLM